MTRTNLSKTMLSFVLTISTSATAMDARKLECSYDYVTHKIVKRISETANDTGNLDYTYHHELGSGGKDMWVFDKEPPTLETKSSKPYINMWGDLFWGSDKYFPDVVYIETSA